MRGILALRRLAVLAPALVLAGGLWLLLGVVLGGGVETQVAGQPLAPVCQTTISADVTAHTTWTTASGPYCVQPGVDVAQGVTLTLRPGVSIYFLSSTSGLTVSGNLVALGTTAQPITLTSFQSAPQPGDWIGLVLLGGGRMRLDHVDISYAGYGRRTQWYHNGCTNPDYFSLPGDGAGAIWLENYGPVAAHADLELRHSRLHHNRGSGLVFHGEAFQSSGGADGWVAHIEETAIDHNTGAAICEDRDWIEELRTFPSYVDLTLTNNGADVLMITYSPTYYGDRTLDGPGALNGSPIHLVGGTWIHIRDGATLTIMPGTTVLFSPAKGPEGRITGGIYAAAWDGGRLVAEGTPTHPITFTSGLPAPSVGDWGYLEIGGSLAYCDISYAGRPLTDTTAHSEAVTVEYNASVRRCNIHHNDAGIEVTNINDFGLAVIAENDIHHNRIGLYTDLASPSLRGNSIHDNREYGLIAYSPYYHIDARFTWWGHPTGPYHPVANPNGLGDRVEDYSYQGYAALSVVLAPWRTSPVEGSAPTLAVVAPADGATLAGLPQQFQLRAEDADEGEPLYLRVNLYAGYALIATYDQSVDAEGWDRAVYYPDAAGAVTATLALPDMLPDGDYAWEASIYDGWHTVATARQSFLVDVSGWGISGVTPAQPVATPGLQVLIISGAGFDAGAQVWLEQARYDGVVSRLDLSYRQVASSERIDAYVNFLGRSGPWDVVLSQGGQVRRATIYVSPYLALMSFDYMNEAVLVMNHITSHNLRLVNHGTAPGIAIVGVIVPTGTQVLLPNKPAAGMEYLGQVADRTHLYAIEVGAQETRFDTLYYQLPQTAVNLPGDPIDPTKWDWEDPLRFKFWVIAQPTVPGWQVLRAETTSLDQLINGAVWGSALIEGWAHDQYAELADAAAAAEYLERLGAVYPLIADALFMRQLQDLQLLSTEALGIVDETLASASLSPTGPDLSAMVADDETIGEWIRRQIGDPWSFAKGFLLQANEDGIPWSSSEMEYDRGTLLVAQAEGLLDGLTVGLWKPRIGYWNYYHINGEEQGLVDIGHPLGNFLSIPLGFGIQEAVPKGAVSLVRKAAEGLRPGGDLYWGTFKLTVAGNKTEPTRMGLSVIWKGGDDWVSREVGRDYNLIHWGDNPNFGGSHWSIGWTREPVIVDDMIQYGANNEVLFGSGGHLYTNHAYIPYKWNGRPIGEINLTEMRALLSYQYQVPVALWRSGTVPELLQFPANFADGTACADGSQTLGASWDPNDLTGYPLRTHIRPTQELEYLIRFENVATATLAAETVTVTLPIDVNLEWDSMTLLGSSHPQTVTAMASAVARTLQWVFAGINLPPNDTPPAGEGWVRVRILPSMPLTTGQQITAQASIVFDQNDPIMTNIVTYTVDLHPPVPGVSLAGHDGPFPLVRLTGTDNVGGSGTTHVGLYYSRDGATWEAGPVVTTGVTPTQVLSGVVPLVVGSGHYRLRAAAVDATGNVSPLSATTIEVDVVVPHEIRLPLLIRRAQ